jgi:hypothetical protein
MCQVRQFFSPLPGPINIVDLMICIILPQVCREIKSKSINYSQKRSFLGVFLLDCKEERLNVYKQPLLHRSWDWEKLMDG